MYFVIMAVLKVYCPCIYQIDQQSNQIQELMEKMDYLLDAVQPLLRHHVTEKVRTVQGVNPDRKHDIGFVLNVIIASFAVSNGSFCR